MINKRKCFTCQEEQSISNPSCTSCINSPNLTDNYKEQRNELEKIFPGAPMMLRSDDSWYLIYYYNENVKDKPHYRLPTVNEAPRNIFLAPWPKEPEELKDLNVWCKVEGEFENLYRLEGVQWEEITSLIILGEFK